MDIFVVTNGKYDDEAIVGVVLSEDDADAMIVKARQSGRFTDNDPDDYDVYGPFTPGDIHTWKGVLR